MNANFYITTPPTTEAIASSDLEAALRLGSGFDSTTVSRLIPAACRKVELDAERSLTTRTITGKLDNWPQGGIIHLPYPPFINVTSLKYYDTDGQEQELVEDTDFEVKVSGDAGRLVVVPGGSWPSLQSDKKEAIEVVYQAGYGATAADVPGDLREACVKMGVMMYTNGAIDDTIYKMIIKANMDYFESHWND